MPMSGAATSRDRSGASEGSPRAARAARATIRDAVSNWSMTSYWLDAGNSLDSGQFILGEPLNQRNRRSRLRLRSAAELYPEIVDPGLDDDTEPSCSAVEALERQSPFVNSVLAQHALALLARLFRYGEISYHGGFVNLATGATSVLRIDPHCWKRTRRLNKRSAMRGQAEENNAHLRAAQRGVDDPDRRA